MNLDVLTVLLALLGGLVAITMAFYGGALVLRWLEMPDSPQALASPVVQTAPKAKSVSV
jgi:hypothetical protein